MSPQHAQWALPEVIDPLDHICFQIQVPNDRNHIAAFLGAIFSLSTPYSWQNDDAHSAILVGRVWRKIFYDLHRNNCTVCPPVLAGIEEDQEVPIRVDCDCNVFVTCCDGTEKQILTSDQVQALITGQPGAGSPLPPPNGGCQQYHFELPGNGLRLSPAVVSTGDTINVIAEQGIFYEGTSALWFCPDGFQFYDGVCTGVTVLNGANPMPSVPTGKLIAKIGSTYYDVFPGPFTVPGGISNQQLTFIQNTNDITGSGGNVSFDAIICNNQAGSYRHVFDLTAGLGGWVPNQPEFPGTNQDWCDWVPGTGFVANCVNQGGSTNLLALACQLGPLAGINFDTLEAICDVDNAGDGGQFQCAIYYGGTVTSDLQTQAIVNGTNVHYLVANTNHRACTFLVIYFPIFEDNSGGCSTALGTLKQIIVSGIGADPF